MASSLGSTLWRRKRGGPRRRVRAAIRRGPQMEALEPRLLLATYTWERKNDGSQQTGWTTTNTGDWIRSDFSYPNSNQWTAPAHVSESIWTAPGPSSGKPSTGSLVIDQPGNWNLSDYPNAADADVVIGKGADVRLSGYVSFPYAGSPRLSGSVAIRNLDNAGSLETYQADGAGEGILNVYGGTFKNDGTITLTGGAGSGGSLGFHAAGVTPLTGAGKIVMQDGEIFRPAAGQGTISQAATHSITGKGLVNVPISANAGTVSSDSGGTIALDLKGVTLANTGLLQAATTKAAVGSTLSIGGGTIANTGGTIRAQGDASRVSLANVTLVGGTLATSGTGVIQTGAGVSWKGAVTTAGTVSVALNQTLALDDVGPLTGGGTIGLSSATLKIVGARTVSDTDIRIVGAGSLTGDTGAALSLGTAATVSAEGGTLDIAIPVTAAGGLRAAKSGVLRVGKDITGTGSITAADGSSVTIVDGARIAGVALASEGSGKIVVTSGLFDGAASILENKAPVVLQGTLSVKGSIRNTGSIELSSGGFSPIKLAADLALSGGGTVKLGGGLIGGTGTLTNTDNTLVGVGTIGTGLSAVTNAGTIWVVPTGSSAANGSFAEAGNTISVTASLTNTGTIKTDTNGFLTFQGSLLNKGSLAGHSLTTQSAATNASGATISVASLLESQAAFTNDGTLTTRNASFTSVTHGATGALVTQAGDEIYVRGDFLNTSTRAADWNTVGTTLTLDAPGSTAVHRLQLPGRDLGTGASGWTNNFSWGRLRLWDSGESIVLESGRKDGTTAAGYVGVLEGVSFSGNPADGMQTITNITGNGLNLYYDPQLTGNGYLGGRAYALVAGGMLLPKAAPTPATAPAAATGVVAVVAGTQATLSWTAPQTTGGAPILKYIFQYSTDGGSSWMNGSDAISTANSATVTGLAAGTYRFRVSTVNYMGATPSAASAPVTVVTAPTAPFILEATPGSTAVTLAWSTPSNTGGSPVKDYVVQYTTTPASQNPTWLTFDDGTSTATAATVTGLTNGTAYLFRVAAVNVVGTSPFSDSSGSVTPTVSVPGRPTNLSFSAGNGQVSISWSAPPDGGLPIGDYVVEYRTNNGSTWSTFADGTSTKTSVTVTGLTNGTAYVFRVSAVNPQGAGAATFDSPPITPTAPATTIPGQPTSLLTTASNGQVAVSWTAPLSDGGSAITDYVVQYMPLIFPQVDWTTLVRSASTKTQATVTGLTNGTAYMFRVAAVNAKGTGLFASAPQPATPVGLPSAPVNPQGVPGDKQVSLIWSTPTSNGGSMISDYIVQYRAASALTWQTFADGASPKQFTTVTGLVNGTGYVFRVAAVNATGTGPFSAATATVTPTGPTLRTIGSLAAVTTTYGTASGTSRIDVIGVGLSGSITASAPTGFEISPNGVSFGPTATFQPFDGLASGTVHVRLSAGTAAGTYSGTVTFSSTGAVSASATMPASVVGRKAVTITGLSVQSKPYDGTTAATVSGKAAVFGRVGSDDLTLSGTPVAAFATRNAGAGTAVAITGLSLGGAKAANYTLTPLKLSADITARTLLVRAADKTRIVNTVNPPLTATITGFAPGETAATALVGAASLTTTATQASPAGTYAIRVAKGTLAVKNGNYTLTGFTDGVLRVIGRPGTPTNLAVAPGNGRATLSWTAPANTGGGPITDYLVEYRLATATAWVRFADGVSGATSATVTGLVNGAGYVFRVAAVTAAGPGTFTGASVAAKPRVG